MLNKTKGNMYPFIDATWNVLKGKCAHDCKYCYMKVYKQKALRFDEKELKTDLGCGNFIFVGSSTDMWAENVLSVQIRTILEYTRKFSNRYLFQSKNPERFHEFVGYFPEDVVFGTTLETNRNDLGKKISHAPTVTDRVCYLAIMRGTKMVTIEPIVDFDIVEFIEKIRFIKPRWVNIGADSKGHKLPEPPKEKIQELIAELKTFTDVKLKTNLNRLMK